MHLLFWSCSRRCCSCSSRRAALCLPQHTARACVLFSLCSECPPSVAGPPSVISSAGRTGGRHVQALWTPPSNVIPRLLCVLSLVIQHFTSCPRRPGRHIDVQSQMEKLVSAAFSLRPVLLLSKWWQRHQVPPGQQTGAPHPSHTTTPSLLPSLGFVAS